MNKIMGYTVRNCELNRNPSLTSIYLKILYVRGYFFQNLDELFSKVGINFIFSSSYRKYLIFLTYARIDENYSKG